MNVVKLTLFVVLVGGAYLGRIVVPLWLDDFDVREAVAAGLGQMAAENAALDAGVQKMVAGRLAKVGTHWEEQDGQQVEVPGLGLDPAEVVVERNADGRTGRVAVDYARTVRLWPLKQLWTLRFHTAREGALRP